MNKVKSRGPSEWRVYGWGRNAWLLPVFLVYCFSNYFTRKQTKVVTGEHAPNIRDTPQIEQDHKKYPTVEGCLSTPNKVTRSFPSLSWSFELYTLLNSFWKEENWSKIISLKRLIVILYFWFWPWALYWQQRGKKQDLRGDNDLANFLLIAA